METETLILNLGSQATAALAAALTILIATCCRPTAAAKSRPQFTGPSLPAPITRLTATNIDIEDR